jgi:hypothetical protein
MIRYKVAVAPERARRSPCVFRTRPLVPEVPESFNAAASLVDRRLAEGRRRRRAFHYCGRSVTWAALAELVTRCGNAFRDLGVDMEPRGLIAFPDAPDFAAWRAARAGWSCPSLIALPDAPDFAAAVWERVRLRAGGIASTRS